MSVEMNIGRFGLSDVAHLFVNNRAVKANRYADVRDPGRLTDTVGIAAVGEANHAEDAIHSAHVAYPGWRSIPVSRRVALVEAATRALEEIADDLATLLVREQGMLIADTRRDVQNGIRSLKEAAAIAEECMASERHEDAEAVVLLEKDPRGVVGAIIPWNAPIGLAMSKVAPAVLSGNTIVIKPSEFAPLGVFNALLCVANQLPPGVINVVLGGPDVGAVLTRHPLVRRVSFTGGTATGRSVLASASETIKSVGLELGGNDPAIVLDDASPDEIVPPLIKSVFPRSGQVCYAIKRIYVPRSTAARFTERCRQEVDALKVGYGLDPRSSLAPLNNQSQFERVRGLIERAKRDGSSVHELGCRLDPDQWNNGYYLRPALVANIEPDAELVLTEQFGPVIPIVSYDTIEQAVQMANGTEYGLASSVWTEDPVRGLAVARELEAGATFVNSHSRTSLGDRLMPFGGVKQSGLGRVRTRIGFMEYVEHHAISLKKRHSKAEATSEEVTQQIARS